MGKRVLEEECERFRDRIYFDGRGEPSLPGAAHDAPISSLDSR